MFGFCLYVFFTLKLLFSPEGKIYGAQGVGYSGVDKRIDVIAAALRSGKNVYDLQALELAYASVPSSKSMCSEPSIERGMEMNHFVISYE